MTDPDTPSTRGLAALERFIAGLPRTLLATLPTPLVPLHRASDDLGIELWLKRDECTGIAVGGNKARKLEFILADAQAKGHDTVVTTGPVTSNHTMMTTVAARRLGLRVHCVLGGPVPAAPSGNLLLLDYLGATVHFSPIVYADPDPADVKRLGETCREVVQSTGGYWIPGGGSMPVAVPGYMDAVAEIARQRGGVFDFDRVALAFGTGSTTTGVLLGLALGSFSARVDALAVSKQRVIEEVFKRPSSHELFAKSVAALGLDLSPAELPHHDVIFGFAEEGYGIPSRGSDQAIRYLARHEGYLLDPVYTAKAFYGMTEMVKDGRIPAGSRVLFMHTGGLSMTPAAEKRYRPPDETASRPT